MPESPQHLHHVGFRAKGLLGLVARFGLLGLGSKAKGVGLRDWISETHA